MKILKKINFKKTALWAFALAPLIVLPLVMMSVGAPAAESMMRAGEYNEFYVSGMAALGGGIAAIGMVGAGMGQGYAAGKAAEAISRNPEAESQVRSMFLIGSAIAESSALYAFVIAIIALFVV